MVKKKPSVPVVILCGGMGTRLAEETETKPKPLVEIGGRPILWHIMKTYAAFGFTDFILCLGYKGHAIRDYFIGYDHNAQDIKITLGKTPTVVELLGDKPHEDWSIVLADTGNDAMTGARVKRIEKYVKGDHFMLTYGDGLCDVDLSELLAFHKKHGAIGTVTGVQPPSRFGELIVNSNAVGDKAPRVEYFTEKPKASPRQGENRSFINGGYFVFSRKIFKYLSSEDECVLEQKPLEKLSRDGELAMYRHDGFWQCMDTMRDVIFLRDLWSKKAPPWKVW